MQISKVFIYTHRKQRVPPRAQLTYIPHSKRANPQPIQNQQRDREIRAREKKRLKSLRAAPKHFSSRAKTIPPPACWHESAAYACTRQSTSARGHERACLARATQTTKPRARKSASRALESPRSAREPRTSCASSSSSSSSGPLDSCAFSVVLHCCPRVFLLSR